MNQTITERAFTQSAYVVGSLEEPMNRSASGASVPQTMRRPVLL
jgi:hypothetical protein